MTNLLTGIIIGLIIGAFIGGLIVKLFNVTDYQINGKNKAKKGGKIDLTNTLTPGRRLFKRKNK